MVKQNYGSIKTNKVQEIKSWLDSLVKNVNKETAKQRNSKIETFINTNKMAEYPDDWTPTTTEKKVDIKTFYKKFINLSKGVSFDNGDLIFDPEKLTDDEKKEIKDVFLKVKKFEDKLMESCRRKEENNNSLIDNDMERELEKVM